AVAVSAGAAWDRNNTWSGADLASVLDLAATTGTAVQIRDQTGKVVAVSPAFATADGSQSSLPIVVRDQRAGTALVRSTGSGLNAADRSLQTALLRAIAGAAGLAALLGEIHAPGELRELAAAFDQMAGTLDRQEQIRRNLVADVAHELRTPIA